MVIRSLARTPSGYMHARYAGSLGEFGTPRELRRCGGWIIERPIPTFSYRDAMGCYPLFACQDWSQLHLDLDEIGSELVTLTAVLDPFGNYDTDYLHRCFESLVTPFKQHFITDLSRPVGAIVSRHHLRNVRRALRDIRLERCIEPVQLIDQWESLYGNLVQRHNIIGIPAFSRSSFEEQLRVPGMIMFRALYKQDTVGMTLWYVQGEVGYYHLGASSSLGYELCASFGLFWHALHYFAEKLRWLDLGAGAGIGDGTHGLSEFKRGWSTGTRTAYLCGRIFDHARYDEIVKATGTLGAGYFPAYRRGEFG